MERYILNRPLGEGSMGTVYLAHDRLTGDDVALKRVEHMTMNSVEFREALTREFQTLAGLQHPRIVRVLDYGFDDSGRPFFTMSLLRNPRTLLQAANGRSIYGRLSLIAQMLQAVAYLHRQGILHRDLKPGNVLVTPDGNAHVLDFGLAIPVSEVRGDSVGTVLYMAPEVLIGQPAVPASDMFPIGVMLYEILTSTHPYDAVTVSSAMHRILNDAPDVEELRNGILGLLGNLSYNPDDLLVPAYPYSPEGPRDFSNVERAERLTQVVLQLMSKDPAARDLTPYDVIDRLCEALDIAVPVESQAIRSGFLQGARFVGRQQELSQLDNALEQVSFSKGSVWLVHGESGVGKSRLLDELRVRALVHGVRVVRGVADEENMANFSLSRQFLPPLLLDLEVSPDEAGVLKHVVENIDHISGYAIGPPNNSLSMEALRLQSVIIRLLQRIVKPTLLVLEDLQWMGFEGGLVRDITQIAPNLPLLVIGSYRSDEMPYLYGHLHRSQQIELKRFSREELAELSVVMLGNVGRSPQVIDMLQRESEGNITFAIDVLTNLSERSTRLDALDPDELPRDVYTQGIMDIAARRVQRLPLDYQPLMRLAAVAGREIDFDILRHYDHVVNFPLWINAGMNASILTNADGQWRFAHDKLREGILTGLMPEERSRLNRMVADATLELYPEDDRRAAQLARNYMEAREWHDMAVQALRAVDYMKEKGQYRHADALLADLTMALMDQPDASRSRLQLLRERSGLPSLHIDPDTRLNILHESLVLAEALTDNEQVADINADIATLAMHQRDVTTANQHLMTAMQMARQMNDERRLSRLFSLMGGMRLLDQDYAAAEDVMREMLSQARRAELHDRIGVSLNNLAAVAIHRGQFRRALDHVNEALPYLQQDHELKNVEVNAYYNRFLAQFRLHDYQAATMTLDTVDNLMSSDSAYSSHHSLQNALIYRGWLHWRQGDYADADDAFIKAASGSVDNASLRFSALKYTPVVLALQAIQSRDRVPERAMNVIRAMQRLVDDESVQPLALYQGYVLFANTLVLIASGEEATALNAITALQRSPHTNGHLREDVEWLLSTPFMAAFRSDLPDDVSLSISGVMAAFRRRFHY